MANKHASLDALFADIADAIREKTGDSGTIPAVEFPNMIRNKLEVIPPPNPYLTFSSPSSFTLAVLDGMKLWDGKMEFSTDTETWTEWNGEEISSEVSGDSNNLYLRGIGNTIILGDDGAEYYWVLTGSGIKCIGNIENLLDYITVASGNHPTMADRCYYNMFSNCTGLTQAPDLPATTLTEGCYSGMFAGCTGLTQAPALPATTLATYCYRRMFRGCTSITQVPALPATTLTNYCYSMMFYGCTKIKLSKTRTGEYTVAYRIPTTGTGTTASSALSSMITDTGGSFKGTPEINTTYYLSNTNTVVG